MNVTFYNYSGDNTKIQKTLGAGIALTGTLRDTSNFITPEVVVEMTDVDNINYAYIPAFQRYYFIVEKEVLRTNLFRIRMRVDVLKSFQSDILALPAIAARVTGDNGSLYNSYLSDSRMMLQTNDRTGHYHVHSFGWTGDYILITAG